MVLAVDAEALGVVLRSAEEAISGSSATCELFQRRIEETHVALEPLVLDAIVAAVSEALRSPEEPRLGRFLVVGGLDKAGKETQCFNPSGIAGVKSVLEFLEGRGFKVLAINLPSYSTVLGSLVRAYLGKESADSPVRLEGGLPAGLAWILWSLDRAQHNSRVEGWMAQDRSNVVLAKRWTESHLVYQQALGIQAARILTFERNIVQPDCTLVLDVPATEAVERSRHVSRDVDRYEHLSFLARVREHYLQLGTGGLHGVLRFVDGVGSPQDVNRRVLSTLVELGF